MKLPFVSRERFEDLQREHAALQQRYHELRLQGAVAPAQRRAVVTQPPRDPDAEALERMHLDQVQRIAREAGVSPERATAELNAIRAKGLGIEGAPPL